MTIIPCILCAVFPISSKRIQLLEWLVTITAAIVVDLGTLQRVVQISSHEWGQDSGDADIRSYYESSLASWIACIILDGRMIAKIWFTYQTSPLRSLCQLCELTKWQFLELLGLVCSMLYMANYVPVVYSDFHKNIGKVASTPGFT